MSNAQSLPGKVLESAARRGDATALVAENGETLTYRQLEKQVIAAAAAFQAAGVQRGDRICIWAPNSIPWPIATLGLQSVGAILCPINTRYKGMEAAYILNRTRAKILLTFSSFLGVDYRALLANEHTPHLEQILCLDDDSWAAFVERGGGKLTRDEVFASAEAEGGANVSDILFTSGTTGNPKGVMTTHRQNIDVYKSYTAIMNWTETDRLLAINPFFHSFGYKAGWFCALMQGGSAHIVPVFDADNAVDRIENERITMMAGPPTIFTSILNVDRKGRDLTSLRGALTGATIVPVALIGAMKNDLGIGRVCTAYGLTETCGTVSMCRPEDSDETVANTSGRAIPGVVVRALDADGNEVPPGLPGRIVVRGVDVMLGYFDDPEATAKAIDKDGWLDTGDIGTLTPEGNIAITDRAKDVFIVGGFNVYPAEVEQMFMKHPAIAEVAVIGIPDARMGEVGAVFIVTRGVHLSEEDLIAWARGNMANFKVPRRVHFVDALPRNASGKVEKFKLRDLG
jgi:acyl-CoA synthetase (AMP-forming)/AMP-acid ligase II